jgi:hypothetical protein
MIVVLVNAFFGLPPVVVGLVLYVALSRSGPLGFLELLFTPTAMVIAQATLAIPIMTALVHRASERAWERAYRTDARQFIFLRRLSAAGILAGSSTDLAGRWNTPPPTALHPWVVAYPKWASVCAAPLTPPSKNRRGRCPDFASKASC